MDNELLDIIDNENNVVGQELKSVVHAQGLPHRVSAVLLKNTKGQILIPTASSIKVEAGGLFHSAAGHIPSGETYEQGAVREAKEELGIEIDESALEYIGTFWLMKEYETRSEQERFQVYTVLITKDLDDITLNEEQTNGIWLSREDLAKIYTDTPEKLSAGLFLTCNNILFK